MNYSLRVDVYANFTSVCPPDRHGLITVRRRRRREREEEKKTQNDAYEKQKPKANHQSLSIP